MRASSVDDAEAARRASSWTSDGRSPSWSDDPLDVLAASVERPTRSTVDASLELPTVSSCCARSTRPRSGAPASRTSAAATRASRRATGPATSTRSSTTPTGPSSSSRTRRAAARSGPGDADRRSAPTRPGTCPSPRSALVLGESGEIARLHDRQRRVVARHRGREPALPAPGEGLRRRLRDRPGRLRRPTTRRRRSQIEMRITDGGGDVIYEGATTTAQMTRGRSRSWSRGSCATTRSPPGSVLLTGTGLVPPDDFTPRARATCVEIHVPGDRDAGESRRRSPSTLV